MNYHSIYDTLINRARNRELTGYHEIHHIVPRCIGGSEDPTNLVSLTPEEHYLAHQLLIKMYPDEHKLVYAMNSMIRGHHGKRTTRKLYGWLRRRFAEVMSANQKGSNNSQFGTLWITNNIESKKIWITESIPEGWRKGRVIKPRSVKDIPHCRVCGIELDKPIAKYCNTHRKEIKSNQGKRNSKYFIGAGPKSYQGRMFITNGINDKLHPLGTDIPEGWRKGRSNNKHRQEGISGSLVQK